MLKYKTEKIEIFSTDPIGLWKRCQLGSKVSLWGSSPHQNFGSLLLSRLFPSKLWFKISSLYVTYPSWGARGKESSHFLSCPSQICDSSKTLRSRPQIRSRGPRKPQSRPLLKSDLLGSRTRVAPLSP